MNIFKGTVRRCSLSSVSDRIDYAQDHTLVTVVYFAHADASSMLMGTDDRALGRPGAAGRLMEQGAYWICFLPKHAEQAPPREAQPGRF
jgi:hypothetical protein